MTLASEMGGNNPPPDVLRRVLQYNPETGVLIWRERPCEMFITSNRSQQGNANNWNARYAGKEAFTSTMAGGYKVGAIFDISFRAHRVIWALQTGEWPNSNIDHINGDPSDNRWVNLRDVPQSINARNCRIRKDNSSGAVGVDWDKRNSKWRARIGKRFIGYFDTKDAAIVARKVAEKQHDYHPNHGRPA